MSFIDKILGKGKDAVINDIGQVIDNLSTSDAEKSDAKQKLTETVMGHLNRAMELQQNIIVTEAQGNWLQRSWRPVLMLTFGFLVTYRYFIGPVFGLNNPELPDNFWSLLEIGMGGYVIGRSVEKVADTVTKNVDMSFIRKKDRK